MSGHVDFDRLRQEVRVKVVPPESSGASSTPAVSTAAAATSGIRTKSQKNRLGPQPQQQIGTIGGVATSAMVEVQQASNHWRFNPAATI